MVLALRLCKFPPKQFPNLTFLRQKTKSGKNGIENEVDYPEAPTTCCMSGCANCVWLDYAEKLNQYYKDGGEKAAEKINEQIEDPSLRAFLLHELRMRQSPGEK